MWVFTFPFSQELLLTCMIVVMKEPSMERYQTAQTKETSLVTISAVTFVERHTRPSRDETGMCNKNV